VASISLIERARQGDSESQDTLVRVLWPRLVSEARQRCGDPTLAEDICQEACLNLLHRLPQLRDPALLLPWALSFVANHTRRTLRALQNHPLHADLDLAAASLVASDPPPWAGADFNLLLALLWKHSTPLRVPACAIAAFMLECYGQEHAFPHVRTTAQACRLSVSTAERGCTAVLIHWRHVLTAAGLAP
jgi:hypothetical protein